MARYRKVDSRIWNDEKFRALSRDGQFAFLFVLTHPHMTALGAMRATLGGLAEEIGWPPEAFREAFAEASSKGMAKHDPKASFLWLPNFLKYNRPESPNVVKAWGAAFDLLPECELKDQLLQHVKAFAEGLSQGFRKAFAEAFREDLAKGMPNPEPEPEQEPEQDYLHTHTRAREKERPVYVDQGDAIEHANFSKLRALYPKTTGRVDWIAAEKHARTLVLNQEATWGELEEGVRRYAVHVRATGRLVMNPANFFGAHDRPWSQEWPIPDLQPRRLRVMVPPKTADELEAEERARASQ